MTNFELRTEVFANARREKRMTPAQFALHCGLSENMVRRMEKGSRQPSEATLMKLADKLNIPWRRLVRKASRAA